MGMVNRVVDHADLQLPGAGVGPQDQRQVADRPADAEVLLQPNIDDGLVGQQLFAGETTRLAYMTDEAVEGRDSVPREA